MTDPLHERLTAALAATYQLGEELVGGGMSRVFVATEHALGRKVVIKVLPPELSAGVNRDRFQQEIQVAAQLQHPHIVPLLSAGRVPIAALTAQSGHAGERAGPSPDVPSPDVPASSDSREGELLYYTMPFIEGESLRTAVARRGRLPVREVVRMNATYFVRPDGAIVLHVQVFDVARNHVVGVLQSKPIARAEPLRDVGELIAGVLAALDHVSW